MSDRKQGRLGAIAYTRERWGRRFLATVIGPGLFLALSVVVYRVAVDEQSISEALSENLGPILIAGGFGVLLWLSVAAAWGVRQQRDEAWSELDALGTLGEGPPSLELTPLMSEKVGSGRYHWLTKASERHEMKVVVKNLGKSGEFSARGYWHNNRTPWDIVWHGRDERITEIAEHGDATMVVALAVPLRTFWRAYGVLPGREIRPRAAIGSQGAALEVVIRKIGIDEPYVSGLRLIGPGSVDGRPSLLAEPPRGT